MGFDPELLKQLIATFKIELEEQLQVMTDGLLDLEKSSAEDIEQIKHIDSIFRAAHNIKGAARSLDISNVADIAHHIEFLFASLQKRELVISPSIVDRCLEAIDKMRLAMQFYLENQPISFNLDDLLTRLEKKEPGAVKAKEKPAPTKSKPQTKPTRSKNLNTKTKQIKSITVTPEATPKQQRPPTAPTVHETVRVSIDQLERIAALMEELQINKIAIDEHATELTNLTINTKQLMQLWQKAQVLENDAFSVKNVTSRASSRAREGSPFNQEIPHYVRDDVEKERLLKINLNLQKIYSVSNTHLIEINQSIEQLNKNMRLRMNELTILSHSLQEEVRRLRLIPAANFLQTLPRVARDLANEMHKKVELLIRGDDVKMDKMVLEGIKDPIIHLLRNAIDHGIEDPSQRLAKGKSEIGHIGLDVVDEGNQIVIRIKDDGAGINVDDIVATCVKKNLLSTTELQEMGASDILELVFRPGFSTREMITNVSGRGIGLNVVKENVTHLKGQVGISTELGRGTTFDLRVPLTLASERGLILRSCGQLFVIPSVSVEKVLSIKSTDIIEVGGQQAILIDKYTVPLRSLADILNLEENNPLRTDQLTLVVIKKGWHAIALMVETILGEREIVVKPMQAPLENVKGIAGGTLSASGQVMIVLNASDILTLTQQSEKLTRVIMEDDNTLTPVAPHILVVDDSITTRTLEKSILGNKGYQVTTVVDGKEAWELLQKQTFSLLITDVVMPNVDGFTLTERVKNTTRLQNMPVIIVTSLGSDAEKKRGIEVGADAYIVKNEFESGILLEIVEQLV